MLGLYLYTLIITIISIYILKKKQQQQNKKSNIKNPCRSRELNREPLAPKSDALPLHHQVN